MKLFNDKRFSDFDLQAFVDNELNAEEARRFETYIRANQAAAQRYNQLMAQKNLLNLWFGHHNHGSCKIL